MQIVCSNIHKKYNKHYIIKDFSAQFSNQKIVGIKGSNGSGKSTLLKMISSVLTPSSGSIVYLKNNKELMIPQVRSLFSFVAPAIELLGSLTVEQTIDFHFQFKKLYLLADESEFLDSIWLEKQQKTLVNDLSSGMRQRLKLGLAFYSKGDFILLDEPTSNLDKEGISWVNNLIESSKNDRGLIIASNEDRDFTYCDELIDVLDYK